jgi:pimeloyl-ACP methyl ester carboxylesterase
MSDLIIREYGSDVEPVIILHGGPAAVEDVAPLARELGKRWHALEPLQRGSGSVPLEVRTHVQDLDDVIRERCSGRRPILVGHSWGAMLGLAYAATHPTNISALVLIGCGTFSLTARLEFQARLDAQLTEADRALIAQLQNGEADQDRCFAALGRLMTQVYGYNLEEIPDVVVDALAYEETWADMLRLQRDGVYPAAFSAITVPVLMLHGQADPHPGRLIRDDLQKYIPQLEYIELPHCGHSPWLERLAKQSFFDLLNTWVAMQFQRIAHEGG